MKLRIATPPAMTPGLVAARLALATWMLARRDGGRLALRLQDIQPQEPRRGAAHDDAAQHDLAWLGLDWDEEVRQSARQWRYDDAADQLRRVGRLYPCFETEEELRSKQEQRRRRGQATIYDRAMLKLTAAQRAEAEAGGKRPYWRFQLNGADVRWVDLVLGRQAVKLSAMSDPVLVRSDGTPLPLFAGVIDDVDAGITHVLRGADELGATGLGIDIAAALGGRAGGIRFGHLAAPPGERLPTLRSLRADGIEPTAVAGLLARMGTSDKPAAEPPALLASRFDPARFDAAPAFDPAALLALNRRALSGLPFEAVRDRLPEGATSEFWHAVRGGIDLLPEARDWWDVVAGAVTPAAAAPEGALAALPPEPWATGTWDAWLTTLGARHGPALRLALTGEAEGPAMSGLLPLMGRARVAARLG